LARRRWAFLNAARVFLGHLTIKRDEHYPTNDICFQQDGIAEPTICLERHARNTRLPRICERFFRAACGCSMAAAIMASDLPTVIN
jgi:hypothetical protein